MPRLPGATLRPAHQTGNCVVLTAYVSARHMYACCAARPQWGQQGPAGILSDLPLETATGIPTGVLETGMVGSTVAAAAAGSAVAKPAAAPIVEDNNAQRRQWKAPGNTVMAAMQGAAVTDIAATQTASAIKITPGDGSSNEPDGRRPKDEQATATSHSRGEECATIKVSAAPDSPAQKDPEAGKSPKAVQPAEPRSPVGASSSASQPETSLDEVKPQSSEELPADTDELEEISPVVVNAGSTVTLQSLPSDQGGNEEQLEAEVAAILSQETAEQGQHSSDRDASKPVSVIHVLDAADGPDMPTVLQKTSNVVEEAETALTLANSEPREGTTDEVSPLAFSSKDLPISNTQAAYKLGEHSLWNSLCIHICWR